MASLRVLLADDHAVYRLGLRALLESIERFEVVGEAASGAEAVEAAGQTRPDVVVMDLRMPDGGGIAATRRIVERYPDVAVLVLTYSDENESVAEAIAAGARGYVLKEATTDDIIRAIEDVGSGEMILGSAIAARAAELFRPGPPEPARPFPELTAREYEVLELVAQGLGNAVIARRLGIGEKRVRNCMTTVYYKLRVADRPEAIIRARNAGLGRSAGRDPP